jgi:protein SCO1/2
MSRHLSTTRRRYVAAGLAAASGSAGCLQGGELAGGSDGPQAFLDPPDRRVESADLPYPAYGQELPDATLPAPLRDTEVSTGEIGTDVFLTFFYSHCKTVCPRLVGSLRNIRTRAASEGHGDDLTLMAATFDPERDTADRLGEYRELIGLDPDADNWYFLQPESRDRAETVITDQFGVPYERTQSEDADGYMFTHFSLILLANGTGTVERAYTNKRPVWQELYDDFTTLRRREG